MTRLTDEQVLARIKTDDVYNHVRRVFSSQCAKIEQAGQQRTVLGGIDLRRMEFEAVDEIMQAAGFMPEAWRE